MLKLSIFTFVTILSIPAGLKADSHFPYFRVKLIQRTGGRHSFYKLAILPSATQVRSSAEMVDYGAGEELTNSKIEELKGVQLFLLRLSTQNQVSREEFLSYRMSGENSARITPEDIRSGVRRRRPRGRPRAVRYTEGRTPLPANLFREQVEFALNAGQISVRELSELAELTPQVWWVEDLP